VVEGDGHLPRVLRYIEGAPVKAGMVDLAGDDYAWSSFSAHGLGEPNDLPDPVSPHEPMADGADGEKRRRKWRRYVHRQVDEDESLAISRSIEIGLPYGSASWVS